MIIDLSSLIEQVINDLIILDLNSTNKSCYTLGILYTENSSQNTR